MLCKDKIISIFCLIDDILQGINHLEDVSRHLSDSEIILTAIVSSTSFLWQSLLSDKVYERIWIYSKDTR